MHLLDTEKEFKPLLVSSTAFANNGIIPKQYTCEGKNVNPPLDIGQIPEEVKSLALIVEDPDAPKGTWLHWLMWNIPVLHHIKENQAPGTAGKNDFGKLSYGGPCPPSGTHRYYFKVYGLDGMMELKEGASRKDFELAMHDHILAYGELMGLYKKSGK